MNLNDVLYTPLDIPDKPVYEINDLKSWLSSNYITLSKYKEILNTNSHASEDVIANYPWDLTIAYYNLSNNGPGWLGDFDKKFPDLSNYIYESFDMTFSDLGLVVFLPIKHNHTGLGFWHNDSDSYGLRHYFEFEHSNVNKLLMRKTKKYRDSRISLFCADEKTISEEIIECRILHNRQSFFLNNINAVHATYTEIQNSTRIACIVTFKYNMMERCKDVITDMVIRSVKKYPEYAILW